MGTPVVLSSSRGARLPQRLLRGERISIAFALLILTAAFVMPRHSAAEPWGVELDASLMLTQTSYSNNWTGGEAGSLSWAFNSNFLAQKQLRPSLQNRNTLKLSFGQTHSQNEETKQWAKPVKSTDLIDLESVLNFTLGGFVDPFVSGRVETQFFDNSDPAANRYFNPATFTESFGIARNLLKQEKRFWSARLGTGLRQHLNRDVLDPLSGERETETTNDGGIEFVSDFKTPLAQERIELTSKLIAFKALFYSESDKLKGLPDEDYWKAPDVRWDNILTASITKYLMVSLYTQLLYDKQIALGGRFKQTLSLGLTYKFKT